MTRPCEWFRLPDGLHELNTCVSSDANLKTIVWTYYKPFFEIPQLPIQSSDDDYDDPLDPIEQAALPRVLDDSVHPSHQ